jgi:tellurite resistance protein TerC
VPAIFGVTREPFIVFTSNIFAILGLRSLYFVLASLVTKFAYLRVSLVVLLGFIGVKMLLTHVYEISIGASLAIILLILTVGIGASLLRKT